MPSMDAITPAQFQVPQALHCPSCKGSFFSSHSITQCPHCGRQGPATKFQTAQLLKFEDLEHPRASEQASIHGRKKRRSTMLFFALSAVSVLLAMTMAYAILNKRSLNRTAAAEALAERSAEGHEALTLMKQFMSASKSQPPPSFVRDTARVQPLWTWFYAQPDAQDYKSNLQNNLKPTFYEMDGMKIMAVSLIGSRDKIDLLFEQTDGGWKLDWEALSGVHGGRWKLFLNQERGLGPEGVYCVHVEPMPTSLIMDSFKKKHPEVAEQETLVMRLFCMDQAKDAAACILTKNDPLALQFSKIRPSQQPQRYTLKLKLLDGIAYPPLVEVLKVTQEGWKQLPPPPQPAT
jgi:uncharacterized Zn finger protein (UPF0148 family)